MVRNKYIHRIAIIVWTVVLLSCSGESVFIEDDPMEERDILEKLQSLPGASVTELTTIDHYKRLFEIMIDQPIDHDSNDGRSFKQKLFLGHVDENKPIIFETEGYARRNPLTRELASRLSTNQLSVEHRFYGDSVPSPHNWKDLTIWQASNDHHRIVELFKEIYPNAWISSGVSKGGDTAIFHRRFFPDDVNGTVAYVAPILLEKEDRRFLSDFSRRGSPSCRANIESFQRRILERLDFMPPIFDNYVQSVNRDFDVNFQFTIPYKNIIYHSVRKDYVFEFWSSESEDCGSIPDESATDLELFDHYARVFNVFLFFSDSGAAFWTPYCYQALTELGNYAWKKDHLEDLVRNIPELVDFGLPTIFNSNPMAEVSSWLSTEAENMIFIYGSQDPWTIAAVDVQSSASVMKFTSENTKHSTRIPDLTLSEIQSVNDLLQSWILAR